MLWHRCDASYDRPLHTTYVFMENKKNISKDGSGQAAQILCLQLFSSVRTFTVRIIQLMQPIKVNIRISQS